jgi:hypothetical protein
MLLLDRLSPLERASFLLHDVAAEGNRLLQRAER